MSQKKQTIHLEQVGTAAFQATAGSGGGAIVDGAPEIGGEGRGMRPTEMLLSALASCSAMDVLHILRRQKEPIEHLTIDADGLRKDAVPAPFTKIHLVFTARGAVDPHKLERAVGLAVEKYCSVRDTLRPDVEITWEARLAGAPLEPAE